MFADAVTCALEYAADEANDDMPCKCQAQGHIELPELKHFKALTTQPLVIAGDEGADETGLAFDGGHKELSAGRGGAGAAATVATAKQKPKKATLKFPTYKTPPV